MKFYFSLKVITGNKKSKFSKKQQTWHKQTIEIKQVKQKATLKNNDSSSQTAEFHPCSGFPKITQLINRSNCFIHSSVWSVILLKECKANAQSLTLTVHPSQWREHRIWVCSRLVSCWLRVLMGHRVSIISVIEWHKSCWNHVPWTVRVHKDIRVMLLINKTVMPIVTGYALGFFTGSGNVIPFSVDLSDFCRRFMVESITTTKFSWVAMSSSSMKCTMSSKETVFLKIWPRVDKRSSSEHKID